MKIIYGLVLILICSCKGNGSTTNNTAAGQGPDTTLKWIDYREGELPPVGYYSAWDSTIKKWNIRYERIEGGCAIIPGEKLRYEQNNKKYFRLLEQQFGQDWRRRFDIEVSRLDSFLQERK